MRILTASLCSIILLSTATIIHANELNYSEPTWNPQNTERLVRLPANYMKKSVDYDFKQSTLGQALQETEKEIELKGGTLSDLNQSVEASNDVEVQIELRHQLLAEKKAFVDLMERKNNLRKQQLTTRIKLFEKMLKTEGSSGKGDSPERIALIDKQNVARGRFESTSEKIDIHMFNSVNATESKYSTKYSENLQAMEKLMSRIKEHEANQTSYDSGQIDMTKEEYIRKIITDSQAELALMKQEESIIAYMSKLVALDALALSEELLDSELIANSMTVSTNVAKSVDVFLNN